MLRRLQLTLIALCAIIPFAQAEVPHVTIGKFPQEVAAVYTIDDGLPSNDVSAVYVGTDARIYVQTASGWAMLNGKSWKEIQAPSPEILASAPTPASYASLKGVNEAAAGPDGQIVAATEGGLYASSGSGFNQITIADEMGRHWAVSDVRGADFDSTGQLWVATLAGVASQTAEGWKFYTGHEGLPYNDFTCVEGAPNGDVWFGTSLGAIRRDADGDWHYRQGRRWLPSDEVRDIVIDGDGTVWFATAGGVGAIGYKRMTLAEKAAIYEEVMDKYIGRTEFSYFSEVSVNEPGNIDSGINYSDSDNDGLWTAMYGAGECFGYAATGNPKNKERAKKAFEALRHLQKVTQGGEHSPPLGYVARTVLPTDGPDPNEGRLARDIENQKRDYLWKAYEPRWPKSADGKWYWKSDTSSDELDGHYFFYPAYYDLVADTEEEKERVREVVRDLTDHLVKHGFKLIDHDGTVTRWSIYDPYSLNHDKNWWVERGLKSLSMLSYLAVAEHVTGDPVYAKHAQYLIDEHAYETNAMIYKIHQGPGSGNHSDDEMAFMSYYNLLKYSKNEDLKQRMQFSFFSAWTNEQPEMNPFFNFAYAAFGLGATAVTPFGVWPLSPWDGWLEDSIATLTGFPLDRFNWAHKNDHRLDIVPLHRQQEGELVEKYRRNQGYRVNGKVIPVENRFFNHWNSNPWQLNYGGDGTGLASGAVYLLPYYLGLYHGFIVESE